MELPRPYFLENPAWYSFDSENCRYTLTDAAPPKAIKSYEEFYTALDDGADME